ncbi:MULTISPECIES: terminase small subunit [unclassified Fusibacter]|uniref:terminase small subunit n=1 Tax=unclassified Fusibacter TaxID=2624464 RepID=UPI0013E93800|nr:terminase small subunit [Fusibacter sp. A1]MCK8059725.1 terminase small subunit [Fusibacter sp. A2]NPE21526.1 terminase small subunit [Fusibacter sp. A1]
MRKKENLTVKEELFVQELINGSSQRQAYKDAGYKTDTMDDELIDKKASEVFNRAHVKERYDAYRNRVIKEAEDDCIITAKEVLQELKSIAMDDINNYVSYQTVLIKVGETKDGECIYEQRTVVQLNDLENIDTKNIKELKVLKDGRIFLKLYPRDDALEKLGRHLKLFVDRIEATVDSELIVRLEGDLEEWSH